jgi:hypothetical protein
VSQESVDSVSRIYATWAEQGSPVASGLLDPDIEWVNQPEPAKGIQIDELFDVGDRVVVVATVDDSGVDGARHSYLWTLRDGKAIRFERFSSPDGALIAAGVHCSR